MTAVATNQEPTPDPEPTPDIAEPDQGDYGQETTEPDITEPPLAEEPPAVTGGSLRFDAEVGDNKVGVEPSTLSDGHFLTVHPEGDPNGWNARVTRADLEIHPYIWVWQPGESSSSIIIQSDSMADR